MDYEGTYNKLIERARSRTLEAYGENHHILPRCMGGGDEPENIARLTGREHFVAHVLLVKIYPEEHLLIYAVHMMCRFGKKQERSKNRMYGWLRERHSKTVSRINSAAQKGSKNSQYGTCWCVKETDKDILGRKKFKKENVPEGWITTTQWRDNKKPRMANYGKHWYNDYFKNYFLHSNDNLIKENNLKRGRLV